MTRSELKALIRETIQEAHILPDESKIAEVRAIVEKYLKDKKKFNIANVAHWFRKGLSILDEDFYDAIRVNQLLPNDIQFEYTYGNERGSYIPKTDTITLSSKFLAGKYGGLDGMEETLGHELIHREQFRRGAKLPDQDKMKARYKGNETEAYLNQSIEVMAWGYSLVRDYIHDIPDATVDDVYYYINNDDNFKKFLAKYDMRNKNKVLRYMVDYAQKLLKKG